MSTLKTTILIFLNYIGFLQARHTDIDINRVKIVPSEDLQTEYLPQTPFSRPNAYDYHSSGYTQPGSPIRTLHESSIASTPSADAKKTIHPSREDPKLFYQSQTYLQEISKKKLNNEVSQIYPGNDVVMATEEVDNYLSLPIQYSAANEVQFCVKCPNDRLLVAKPESERIMFQNPHLKACSGRPVPRSIHFEHWYGPAFGSLLGEGSYVIVGRLVHNNNTLKVCRMNVQVVIENNNCPRPKYLSTKCDWQIRTCNFTCRNPKLDFQGQSSLRCGDNMRWEGELPVCRPRSWCKPPQPPKHGRISCHGTTVVNGTGLIDGSRCRVRCHHGYRWRHGLVAVCRRGSWTHHLICKRKKTIKKRSRHENNDHHETLTKNYSMHKTNTQ